MRPVDFAKLFASYFISSQGNIGISLLNWIANIKSYKNGIIEMQYPKLLNDAVFSSLNSDIYMLLLQFFLHKSMSADKIIRVTLLSEEKINETLAFLKRSGLITEQNEGIYEINSFMYIHLRQQLQNNGML